MNVRNKPRTSIYTAKCAADASQRGAWITAWPADEVCELPIIETEPTLPLGRPSASRSSITNSI